VTSFVDDTLGPRFVALLDRAVGAAEFAALKAGA
jgi:hypothetical protein